MNEKRRGWGGWVIASLAIVAAGTAGYFFDYRDDGEASLPRQVVIGAMVLSVILLIRKYGQSPQ